MFNNAETYRKMLAYLTARGFDVGSHRNARVASISYASLSELDDIDLQHYETVLEATLAAANEYMDKTAMYEDLNEVKAMLHHASVCKSCKYPHPESQSCEDAAWADDRCPDCFESHSPGDDCEMARQEAAAEAYGDWQYDNMSGN